MRGLLWQWLLLGLVLASAPAGASGKDACEVYAAYAEAVAMASEEQRESVGIASMLALEGLPQVRELEDAHGAALRLLAEAGVTYGEERMRLSPDLSADTVREDAFASCQALRDQARARTAAAARRCAAAAALRSQGIDAGVVAGMDAGSLTASVREVLEAAAPEGLPTGHWLERIGNADVPLVAGLMRNEGALGRGLSGCMEASQ
ncbi:hypothetical protein J2T57_001386 [Natronocella acetinitrilica]|uniref:DUF4439 domain-containing protein n=1 Tax=Natronocella acetinitrilica TaxID=414046 RepID=A0AAE3KB24_9GAMM|nr:hypothetical protein [Natronocella acetinitrilica]MCP1674284.1 hypothetical protein [Natronocella acetinitrilica]